MWSEPRRIQLRRSVPWRSDTIAAAASATINPSKPRQDRAGAGETCEGPTAEVQTGAAIAMPFNPTLCRVVGPVIVPILLKLPLGAIVARFVHTSNVGGTLLRIAQSCPVVSKAGLIICTAPSE